MFIVEKMALPILVPVLLGDITGKVILLLMAVLLFLGQSNCVMPMKVEQWMMMM